MDLLLLLLDMWGGGSSILHGQGGVSAAVGVVDHGIEGLVHPLPEHHCWSGPTGGQERRREKR